MTAGAWLRNLLYPRRPSLPPPVAAGLYHFTRGTDDAVIRFHLRVGPDGSGLLLANAAAAARLTPSGVVMAKGLLEGQDSEAITADICRRFHGVTPAQASSDLTQVQQLLERLAAPGGCYPIFIQGSAVPVAPAARWLAPLSADIPAAAPEQLNPLLDRLWEIGVPHLTLLAPQPSNAGWLVRGVEHAEDLGMIAGVRGRASDLDQGSLLQDLAQAGMDYLTLLYAGEPAVHDALCGLGDHAAAEALIAAALEIGICPVAQLPLVESTLPHLEDTVAALEARGVSNLACFAVIAPEQTGGALRQSLLPAVTARIEAAARAAGLNVLWQPPIARKDNLSLANQVQEGPRCSGSAAVRVEPDGAVIPAHGPYTAAGNLLADPWEQIWAHPAFQQEAHSGESAASAGSI